MHQPCADRIDPIARRKGADTVFVGLRADEVVDHTLHSDTDRENQEQGLGQLQQPTGTTSCRLAADGACGFETVALGMGFLDPRNAAVEIIQIWINPHFFHPE